MPDQAMSAVRHAIPSAGPPAWDVKLALDLGAAIVFTEVDYDGLSTDAQEQALANGYERGEPVMLGVTVERGQAPVFTLFGRERVPNLELIRTTREPRIAPEAAERMRALRKAMPEMSAGGLEWAKAEFHGLQHPETSWVTGADDIRIEQGPFGEEGVGSRRLGVALLDGGLVEAFAGDGASDWLRATLEEGSVALAHAHRLDLYYLRGRAAPDRLLQALEQWWQAEPSPAAFESTIVAEPIEPAPAAPAPASEPPAKATGSGETCWFCGGPADPGSASEVEMYVPESVQRSVEMAGAVDRYVATYQQLRAPVPRCERCRTAHDNEQIWTAGGTILGLAAGGGAAFLAFQQGAIWNLAAPLVVWGGLAVLVIAGGTLGFLFGAARGRKQRGENIRAEATSVEHPLVRQLLEEGYRLGKPEARAPES